MNPMEKIWCRTYQTAMDGASHVLPWRQPLLSEGEGALYDLPGIIENEDCGKVLVVTDPGLMAVGIPQRVTAMLERSGAGYAIYDKVEPNPTDTTVEAIRQMYLDEGCGGFIAVGGGSSMDAAKGAAARIARPNLPLAKMAGLFKITHRLPPFIAIPTTAGTGSETTITAVITDSATHHKYAINDISLIPKYAILDPALTTGLPPAVTAATGMDALTHAVEAYLSVRCNTKETLQWAEEAVAGIFANLENVYQNGDDMEGRTAMLSASFKAGSAFTRTGVGYVHAVAHTLGGLYGTPHGLANAVLLPIVLEEYGSAIYPQLAKLYDAAGLDTGALGVPKKARDFIREIRAMNERMDIPAGFGFIKKKDVPQMIEWALAEANPLYPVPVIFGKKEIYRIIYRARTEA